MILNVNSLVTVFNFSGNRTGDKLLDVIRNNLVLVIKGTPEGRSINKITSANIDLVVSLKRSYSILSNFWTKNLQARFDKITVWTTSACSSGSWDSLCSGMRKHEYGGRELPRCFVLLILQKK